MYCFCSICNYSIKDGFCPSSNRVKGELLRVILTENVLGVSGREMWDCMLLRGWGDLKADLVMQIFIL